MEIAERLSLLSQARLCAWSVHMGQVDKAGRSYVRAHVEDVVRRLAGEGEVTQAVGWLHDVVEDGDPSVLSDLRQAFPPEVVEAVVAITHRPNEPRLAYYARVKTNPIALRVKLADIASNTDPERVALLDEATRERLAVKYEKALAALA
jgi:(p)ppGpp synthase/HD superfamily hydrolase